MYSQRLATPAPSDLSNDDCTSSSQSSYEGGMSLSAPSIKKQTQDVMKSFPMAEQTSDTKKKTNWIYQSDTKKKTNWAYDCKSSPGVHRVVRGKYDEQFKLVEGENSGVNLMMLPKWHMVLPLRGTSLNHSHQKFVLVVRLKLKPNYKVKKTIDGKYYDVNAEDCRMNFNPEGCFLVSESTYECCQGDPSLLQQGELAKFQEKNRNNKSKSYKECKNSVVRACQRVDKKLREGYYEQYMDILYEKAYAVKKNSGKSDAEVEALMGAKPPTSDWQAKRSTRPFDWRLAEGKMSTELSSVSSSVPTEDLFKPSSPYMPSVPENHPINMYPPQMDSPQMPKMLIPLAAMNKDDARGVIAAAHPGAPVNPNLHPGDPLPVPGAHHAFPMIYPVQPGHPGYHMGYGYYCPQPASPMHYAYSHQAVYPAHAYQYPPNHMPYMAPPPMAPANMPHYANYPMYSA